MKSVLSTKILTQSQKELLLNASVQFVHYNAISIEFLDFDLPKEHFDYYIFTSQNAVNAVIKKSIAPKACFCVGDKTKQLLESHGFQVMMVASSAEKLASIVTTNYNSNTFLFFCGNKRRNELPLLLKKNNVRYVELLVYATTLNEKKFEQEFDSILFFSPSGVQSFFNQNKIKDSQAICIGETTAEEAKKYTDKIIVATRPTIENVLVQAVTN